MYDDIRALAPDLYLSLLLTPAPARPALAALYALEAELLKIPSRVTQPTLGVLRVTWWREKLAAGDRAQPLLNDIAQHWPDAAAQLADFAETFSLVFDDISDDDAQKLLTARASLFAAMVGPRLGAPVPDAFAAAAAHYGLSGAMVAMPAAKPLKLIVRLAQRHRANRNSWLGDVWTAIRTSVY